MTLKLDASDKELREQFFELETPDDVANLLEIEYSHLIYYLYRLPPEQQYKTFIIRKKSGGIRQIAAPISPLKIIQQKLNQVLQSVYQPKPSVHGFVANRSIVTNAEVHAKKKYVLNIDLKDFFPSINFGRVRGIFMAAPYQLPEKVATVLAQICSYKNQLPQGAPTSPVVSNMICAKLDGQLQQVAKKYRCLYTRYADDITFSTWASSFSPMLATLHTYLEGQFAEVGVELKQIIEENGFQINFEKVRLHTSKHRQEVTGLTVNEFPNVRRKYVRQIRAMLHDWEVSGLDQAQQNFRLHYKKNHPNQNPFVENAPSFLEVLKGKIEFLGMVRGKTDRIYLNFFNKYKFLLNPTSTEVIEGTPAEIFISYSRKDELFTRKLASALEKCYAKVWLDLDDIGVGKNWSNTVNQGLDECNVMILIVTPDSMKSQNVADEWQYFVDQGKPLIPVLLKPTKKHFQLNRLQHIDFHSQDFDTAFQKLYRALSHEGIALTLDQI